MEAISSSSSNRMYRSIVDVMAVMMVDRERQKEVKKELQNDYKRITVCLYVLLKSRVTFNRRRTVSSYYIPKALISMHYYVCTMNSSSDEDGEMKDLIKERSGVRNALHMADEYLGFSLLEPFTNSQASNSHQALLDQRRRLANSQHRILGIVNRIPGVNSLMRNIQNRKTKDNAIVAVVIGLCVCFILWYMFH